MNILFKSDIIKSFKSTIASYDARNFSKQVIGNDIKYSYLNPDIESYAFSRGMMKEGVEITGFSAYMRMTKIDYNANDVPVGVSNSEVLDGLGVPTGAQKKWFEWNSFVMEKNDTLEVIVPTTYQSQSATVADLDIFDEAVDVQEIIGLKELRATYQNDPLWLLDENAVPLIIAPIDKTAAYYITNWETESFDAVHAQRLVNEWFITIVGASVTDKFNSLSPDERFAVIQWGILPDTSEGNGLIEATILDKNNRSSARLWSYRRLYNARFVRFEAAWIYLIDNFDDAAITTKLQEMLTYQMKGYYISRGSSNQSNHLITNGEINPAFWATFIAGDIAYSDVTLAEMKIELENILDGSSYATITTF